MSVLYILIAKWYIIDMNEFIILAKNAIDEYVKNGSKYEINRDLPAELLTKKAGVFVSIHKKTRNNKDGELRGCIGTFEPTKDNIAQEIVDNAISAASRDFRFDPIKKNELENIDISIDVLSRPELVDNIQTLNPKKYGILIKSKDGARSGLLLPDLNGVDTIHDQIAIALNKAQISAHEPINIYKFTVTRYK